MQNWPWIDRNAPKLGSLVMPWSYTVNSVRYYNSVKKQNRKEIPLPDAKIVSDSKDVCVLIIGESARRENFSLYGYGKPTNPLLEKDSVTALIADAAATYTTAGVKAILDHKPSNKLYEILPNYLYRSGFYLSDIFNKNGWLLRKDPCIQVLDKILLIIGNNTAHAIRLRIRVCMQPCITKAEAVFIQLICHLIRHKVHHAITIRTDDDMFHVPPITSDTESRPHNH